MVAQGPQPKVSATRGRIPSTYSTESPIPDTIPSTSPILICLILTTTIRGRCYITSFFLHMGQPMHRKTDMLKLGNSGASTRARQLPHNHHHTPCCCLLDGLSVGLLGIPLSPTIQALSWGSPGTPTPSPFDLQLHGNLYSGSPILVFPPGARSSLSTVSRTLEKLKLGGRSAEES
jgi:hypothetical protein